jgi:transposase
LLGVTRETVHRWNRTKQSNNSLERNQSSLAGRQPKINSKNAEEILQILKEPAINFGYETDFWTTLRIQQVIKKKLRLNISRMAIHRTLKKFAQSYRKPEIRYYNKNKDRKMVEWKIKTVPQIRRIIRKNHAILYFQDESNISLTPTVGKPGEQKAFRYLKILHLIEDQFLLYQL